MIEPNQVYSECHTHLREADAKRNHLIAFFAVILGLVLKGMPDATSQDQHVLLTSLTAGGLLTTATVMHLMKWHLRYKNCIEYLQTGNKDRGKLKYWKMLPFFSSESTMLGLTGVLAFIPFQMLISKLHCGISLPAPYGYFAVLLNLFGFLLILSSIAFLFIKIEEHKKINQTWIIMGISKTKSQDPPENSVVDH